MYIYITCERSNLKCIITVLVVFTIFAFINALYEIMYVDIIYIILQKIGCEQLNFLKLVKDLKAPIEVSTYNQIYDILQSGKYYIGSKHFRIFNSVEEIIKLRVKHSSSSKQKYTLNELQELESKIVLIRDHRSSSDRLSSDEIEYFLSVRKCYCVIEALLYIAMNFIQVINGMIVYI